MKYKCPELEALRQHFERQMRELDFNYHKNLQNMASKADFIWTDELVKEYGEWANSRGDVFASYPLILVEQFKESKQPKKEYEVIVTAWDLPNRTTAIRKVKRLSDGEFFAVGDLVYETITSNEGSWVIKEFTIKDTRCFSCGINIDSIKHKKPVKILTTEEGKDLFEKDEYWWVDNIDFVIVKSKVYKSVTYNFCKSTKLFSTQQAAQDYVIENKPCLSLMDLAWRSSNKYWLEGIRRVVKDKLNLKDL